MSLQDIEIKKEYRSRLDNVARDFYIPLLKEAVSYKRSVGFFSSSILVEISKGIIGLINNGGKIQLIASPRLSDEDVTAIRKGYQQRNEVIQNALLRQLKEPENKYQADRLNFLANLIADGYLDIKIALTEDGSEIGMYHEKMGIIEDAEGNRVAFSGSNNETANALLANYETVDVDTSWSVDLDRVQSKEASFQAIWHGYEPSIRTIEFDDLSEAIIQKYKKAPVEYESVDYSDDAIPQVEKEY